MNVQKFPARLLVVLTLTLLALLLPAAVQTVSGQPGAVAALDPIQGLIQYRAADAPEDAWQTITRAQLVAEGDWVRTDHQGVAYVTFFEGIETQILPNTLVKIGKFEFADDDSPVITIEQSVGDLHTQIEGVLDPDSQYEVHTPSAVITVRGTNFWSSGTWLSETTVNLAEGITEIKGVDPAGIVGPSMFISANQSLYIPPTGLPGPPGIFTQPLDPPSAPLAPATCGNGQCEADEQQAGTCALDCQVFPNCGNGICELEQLEGPVTCAVDCVPQMRLVEDDNQQTTPGDTLPQATGQACTVRTARADVEVRVGPGFGRGVRDYLKPNVDIPVVGKATDSDGNLWWKIEPPGFLPAEADRYWVLDTNVDETGDCALVQDAAASPVVVPQPPAQPTPNPGSTPAPGQTPTAYTISFYADRYSITRGECVTIFWDVEGIKEVYYQGSGAVGHSSSVECPSDTTTYELHVILLDGTSTYRYVTITVKPGSYD